MLEKDKKSAADQPRTQPQPTCLGPTEGSLAAEKGVRSLQPVVLLLPPGCSRLCAPLLLDCQEKEKKLPIIMPCKMLGYSITHTQA